MLRTEKHPVPEVQAPELDAEGLKVSERVTRCLEVFNAPKIKSVSVSDFIADLYYGACGKMLDLGMALIPISLSFALSGLVFVLLYLVLHR